MSDEDPLLTVEQYASKVFAKFLAVRRPSRAPPEGPARAYLFCECFFSL
jgi:hypothetical protein